MENKPTKFILDTDIGPDVDDVAALYIANLCVNRGDAELLCVTHCTSNPYGVGAIRAINQWCGNPDIPVGTLKKQGFLDGDECQKYNKALAGMVRPEQRESEDSVRVLRRTLAEQSDNDVIMIAIGPLVNIADLLTSESDDISPLSGRELVKQKVHSLYLMAGCFDQNAPSPWTPDHKPVEHAIEWNILMDVPAGKEVIRSWPTPIVFGGSEIGNWVITLKDTSILPEDCPVRLAYDLYTQGAGRMSWDLLVVYKAMDPNCTCVTLSEAGTARIEDDGYMDFSAAECGKHYYMKLTDSDENVAEVLNQYLARG